jgi:hypothetical protein
VFGWSVVSRATRLRRTDLGRRMAAIIAEKKPLDTAPPIPALGV